MNQALLYSESGLYCLKCSSRKSSHKGKHLNREPTEIPTIPRNNYLSNKQTIKNEVNRNQLISSWKVFWPNFRELHKIMDRDRALDTRIDHAFWSGGNTTWPALHRSPNALHFTTKVVKDRAVEVMVVGKGTRNFRERVPEALLSHQTMKPLVKTSDFDPAQQFTDIIHNLLQC